MMITKDKITGIFCTAGRWFLQIFLMKKYTIKYNEKREYHRNSTMPKVGLC